VFLITTDENKKIMKKYNSLYIARHQLKRGIRLGYIERHFYLYYNNHSLRHDTSCKLAGTQGNHDRTAAGVVSCSRGAVASYDPSRNPEVEHCAGKGL
jgi:hypothetical protein